MGDPFIHNFSQIGKYGYLDTVRTVISYVNFENL